MIDILCAIETLDADEQKLTAERIFNEYSRGMYQTAWNVLHHEADAEDAVMEATLKICRNIDNFITLPDDERRLLVITYTKNTAIDKYRANAMKATESVEELFYLPDEDAPSCEPAEEDENLLFQPEDFGMLQQYVLRLPEKYKIILLMKYAEEMKNKEIARQLGLTESTVATQLARAKTMLKNMLKKGRVYETNPV